MRIEIRSNRVGAWRRLEKSRRSLALELKVKPQAGELRKMGSLCALSALVALMALAGCARVAPHQRGRLAHPTMVSGAFGSKAAGHVYAIGEGAMGGKVGASAGCGCN